MLPQDAELDQDLAGSPGLGIRCLCIMHVLQDTWPVQQGCNTAAISDIHARDSWQVAYQGSKAVDMEAIGVKKQNDRATPVSTSKMEDVDIQLVTQTDSGCWLFSTGKGHGRLPGQQSSHLLLKTIRQACCVHNCCSICMCQTDAQVSDSWIPMRANSARCANDCMHKLNPFGFGAARGHLSKVE